MRQFVDQDGGSGDSDDSLEVESSGAKKGKELELLQPTDRHKSTFETDQKKSGMTCLIRFVTVVKKVN